MRNSKISRKIRAIASLLGAGCVCCWLLLVVGCWLPVVDCWLLFSAVVSCCLLLVVVVGCWLLFFFDCCLWQICNCQTPSPCNANTRLSTPPPVKHSHNCQIPSPEMQITNTKSAKMPPGRPVKKNRNPPKSIPRWNFCAFQPDLAVNGKRFKHI